MKVYCTTNLDVDNHECWPRELPERPVVGDRIRSKRKWQNGFQLELKVVATTWVFSNDNGWHLHVELHDYMQRSITEFYKWYAPKVGRLPSAFV